MTKVLFAVTSHYKEDSGLESGCYVMEVATPYFLLVKNGIEIDFVSPMGGAIPAKPFELDHPKVKSFFKDKKANEKFRNSLHPSEVDYTQYDAIYYPGGYGVMYDMPQAAEIAGIAQKIYENGKIVCAVCHGVAGLLNIQLSNGKKLIAGKRLTGFSNNEEVALGADVKVPFLLEDALKEAGADYSCKAIWQSYVVTDDRLITGQNSASDLDLAKELLEKLKNKQLKK